MELLGGKSGKEESGKENANNPNFYKQYLIIVTLGLVNKDLRKRARSISHTFKTFTTNKRNDYLLHTHQYTFCDNKWHKIQVKPVLTRKVLGR